MGGIQNWGSVAFAKDKSVIAGILWLFIVISEILTMKKKINTFSFLWSFASISIGNKSQIHQLSKISWVAKNYVSIGTLMMIQVIYFHIISMQDQNHPLGSIYFLKEFSFNFFGYSHGSIKLGNNGR